jgi:RNA polymerase sigma factor (sigma-70 family)
MLDMLRRLATPAEALGQADQELLRRFAREADEAAFAVLVQRHGPLVLGVCRRLLRQAADVEDAFQATFLVLARRAGRIARPERLPGWLHGVALRIARRLRQQAGRLGQIEAPERLPARNGPAETGCELAEVLDEELARLPERYRAAIALCCLQGLSRDDAARQLGQAPGVVKGLLERGRRQLRRRLERRGLGPAPLAVVPVVLETRLADAAVRTSVAFAAGQAVPAPLAVLAQGAVQGMNLFRWPTLVALGLLALTFAGLGLAVQPGQQPDAKRPPPPGPAVAPRPAPEPGPRGGKIIEVKHKDEVAALAWGKDGKHLFTAGADGIIRLWDVARGKVVAEFKGHDRPVRALALSKDGKRLASAGPAGRTFLWDVEKRKQVAELKTDGDVLGLAFSPDGKVLAGTRMSNEVPRWDGRTGAALPAWRVGDMKETLDSLAFSPDAKRLLVAGRMTLNRGTNWTTFHLLDAATGKRLSGAAGSKQDREALLATSEHRPPVAWSPDGKRWAGGGADGVLFLDRAGTVSTGQGPVVGVVFVRGGRTAASAGADGTIRFVEVRTLKEVARLAKQGPIQALAVSRDGKFLAWARSDGVVRVGTTARLLAGFKVKAKE